MDIDRRTAVAQIAAGVSVFQFFGHDQLVSEFVFSLQYKDSGNWEICQSEGLIGVRSSRRAQERAQEVKRGDTVYVWRGGTPKPRTGLIARLMVAGPGRVAKNPPWPDPQQYTWVIPIEDVVTLETPVPDRFPGNRQGVRFKVENTAVQQGLQMISAESAALMEKCFTDEGFAPVGASPLPDPAAVATQGGWSTDQELIRKVEQAAISAVRSHLRADGWHETRDCQQDGCGYDLLYRRGVDEEMPVEVKGTAGMVRRFVLTRREHEVLSTDARARLYLVMDALVHPKVEALDWRGVSQLGVAPDRWRVGA
ncbi:DUF3883 domain-containing protein [Nocardia sp. NPDC005366]|uniref:protein NO VEIN domain-containing protein n=1 Tax=Nocardia sp. NPDC005366 TaxID=3156878 RepID=UPI0033A87E74